MGGWTDGLMERLRDGGKDGQGDRARGRECREAMF